MREQENEKKIDPEDTQKEFSNQDTGQETKEEPPKTASAEGAEEATKKKKEKKPKLVVEDSDEEKDEKAKDKRTIIYIISTFVLLIVIILLVAIVIKQFSKEEPMLNPDYPPLETDENLKPLPEDDTTKIEHEEGGGAAAFDLSNKLTIDLSDKKASLRFANPGRSTKNMVLWLMIKDTLIAQSGQIPPGYSIDTLDLVKDAEKSLKEGVYEKDCKFIVYLYEPETNERAIVNADFPVTITVKK